MEQECTIPDDNEIETLAELFKIFGDTTRIRILFALCGEERNVSGIAEALDMTQSAVSHQLKILRTARLIRARRDGKQIYYSLADEHVHTAHKAIIPPVGLYQAPPRRGGGAAGAGHVSPPTPPTHASGG